MKKQAKILRETAARLIKQAEELEAGIDRSKCKYGTYTNELFTGCKTCGAPKVVICNNKKNVGKKRNGKLCNPAGCKYFESLKLNT
ncbi:MAG: hypothetical protein KAS17_08655 [Victivallaceae bacterium]|nr:hypothetical protein [Victivallaceae bacterium]